MQPDSLPFRIEAPREALEPEHELLLSEPFASLWAIRAKDPDDPNETKDPNAQNPTANGDSAPNAQSLRSRLLARVSALQAASAGKITARLRHLTAQSLSAGVASRVLYAAPGDRPLRPGEPLRARLIELQAGAHWLGPEATHHREWLVLRGAVHIGGDALHLRDFHVVPAGMPSGSVVAGDRGARLFLRESKLESNEADTPSTVLTVRDASAGWPEFAPGVRRRVLWQRNGQAAMLYHTEPGASVASHTHGHDEECLMVQGDLFLDDVLLQEGDYQIAPAGSGHRTTHTDTGVVLYAHGDLDLRFVD